MKKRLLYLPLVLISLKLFSQVSSISDCVPQLGDALWKIRTLNTSSVNPGPSGTNQSWNFIDMALENTTMYKDTAKVVSTIHAPVHPLANLMWGSSGGTSFYRTGQAGLEKVGVVGPIKYSNPETILPSPLNYGETIIDTWAYTGTISGSTFTATGTTSFTLDASGILVTPGGNFSDVFRVHSISSQISLAPNQTTTSTVKEAYTWYTNGIHIPLMNTVTQKSSDAVISSYSTEFLFYALNQVGITENEMSSKKLEVYPNPANDKLYLKSKDMNINRISLFNTLGEQVLVSDITISDEILQLDISELAQGVYFLKTFDDGGTVTQKKLLIRH